MGKQEIEIILIEDSQDDADLTIRALKKQNLANNLIHLKDGQEALDFFFGKNPLVKEMSPRVIMLDLKMPRVNGIEVLEKLKQNDNTKDIPVVVLTSSAEDPDVKRCYELGANSYIVKPVEFDNFSKTVTDLGLYWMVLNRPCQD